MSADRSGTRWVEKTRDDFSPWEKEALSALRWPLLESPGPAEWEYRLVKEGGQWVLWPKKFSPLKPFKVSFTDPASLRSLRNFGGSNPLAKAMGRAAAPGLQVLDAAAGWLGDALFLAKWGLEVTAVERNPAVYLLVRSALEAASGHKDLTDLIGSRLNYIFADARELSGSWDVVYFDPMFPPKKALSEKPMQILKDLIGEDKDSEKALSSLRSKARSRLVMKRSPRGKPLGEPAYSLESKTVSFDIYL